MAGKRGGRWLRRFLVVAAVTACLAGVAAWRYGPWRQKYAVPLPPPHASPSRVVVAYLRALGATTSCAATAAC